MSVAQGRLPNLVVIGAMKAGTTSLHWYLGQHPEISVSSPKELDFFVEGRNWDRGLDWYRSHFRTEAPVLGESSPRYTIYPLYPGVPERMAAVIPDAKLLYIVRDPIDRIVSTQMLDLRSGWRRPLTERLADPERSDLVQPSRYFMQLERYLAHFPADHIRVVDMHELSAAPEDTLRGIFRFLCVDDTFTTARFTRVQNEAAARRRVGDAVVRFLDRTLGPGRSARFRLATKPLHRLFLRHQTRPELDDALRARLTDYLREDVARLREHTGLGFETWSL